MAYLELREPPPRLRHRQGADGIDISLGEGEFLSLLGPSGCGKTTALRLVAGFDRPDAGRIVVDGKDLTSVAPNKRDMGMVFQAYSLFPNMTARAERRVRPEDPRPRQGRPLEARRRPARARRPRPRGRPLSAPALRRHAAARRARARARDRAARAAARRAALGARREGARAAARGDPPHPARARDHDAVRHARPGGGARRSPTTSRSCTAGAIEQMGTPAEMYSAPATPFVAEFIGTMNRLEAHGRRRRAARSSTAGRRSRSTRRAGGRTGERVLVLIRPETLELSRRERRRGDGNTLAGEVVTQTFLGPVTRLKILGDRRRPDRRRADADARSGFRSDARRRRAAGGEGVRLLELNEDLPEHSRRASSRARR